MGYFGGRGLGWRGWLKVVGEFFFDAFDRLSQIGVVGEFVREKELGVEVLLR